MTNPKTAGGGGGAGASSRRSRVGEVPVAIEPTASATTNDNNINNNSSNSNGGSTIQKTGGVSRLPSIKERERKTVTQKKSRTSSVNDATTTNDNHTTTTTTTTLLQRQESNTTITSTTPTTTTSTPQRRSSVPQGPPQSFLSQKRPTFAGIGRRVSNMVRARMAFQNRRKSTTAAAAEPNHMERIHEMPRNPRFTTFLSPEAQYAVLKGYEDMLYEKIAKSNPESRLVLKRNKTPFHKKISIVDVEGDQQRGEQQDEDEGGKGVRNKVGTPSARGGSTTTTTTTSTTTPTATTFVTPPAPRTPDTLESVDGSARDSATPTSTLTTLPSPFLRKPATRTHSTVSSDVSKSLTSSGAAWGSRSSVGFALHRSSSLPTLNAGLSHRKRLILTYRLESAMDILDTLKRRNMENSLSPRVYRGPPRGVDAVRDFNSWAKVWNKEFKVAHAK